MKYLKLKIKKTMFELGSNLFVEFLLLQPPLNRRHRNFSEEMKIRRPDVEMLPCPISMTWLQEMPFSLTSPLTAVGDWHVPEK